jgi:hypothetical protein
MELTCYIVEFHYQFLNGVQERVVDGTRASAERNPKHVAMMCVQRGKFEETRTRILQSEAHCA